MSIDLTAIAALPGVNNLLAERPAIGGRTRVVLVAARRGFTAADLYTRITIAGDTLSIEHEGRDHHTAEWDEQVQAVMEAVTAMGGRVVVIPQRSAR